MISVPDTSMSMTRPSPGDLRAQPDKATWIRRSERRAYYGSREYDRPVSSKSDELSTNRSACAATPGG
jgi:hypothetical protein